MSSAFAMMSARNWDWRSDPGEATGSFAVAAFDFTAGAFAFAAAFAAGGFAAGGFAFAAGGFAFAAGGFAFAAGVALVFGFFVPFDVLAFALAIAAIVHHHRSMEGGRLADYTQRVFALDVRSLAVMRIAVALTVIVDLGTRAVHLTEHYSDVGVLPREVARTTSWLADLSLLAISGSSIWAGVVFALGFVLAIAVLVGWRTRWTTPLLWLVVLSIQHRNPVLHDHRDVLFALALGFGTLLPWGAAFSIDRDRRGTRYTGTPAIAYVISIACVYLFSAVLKSGPEWRSDFTAVEHAIGVRYWANPAAEHLLDHPTLMSMLTLGVLGFEAAVAPLLLSPWRPALARWLAVGGICALQLGFAIFLWLDTFPMIAAAVTLGLLPPSLWRGEPVDRPAPCRIRTRIGAVVIAYLLALNVLSVASPRALSVVALPAELLGIDQRWTMFAPSPSRVDGWFMVEARTAAGSIDLLTGRPTSSAMPASFRDGIRTTRELVYLRRLLALDDDARHAFAATRCGADTVAIAISFVPVIAGERQSTEMLVEHRCQLGEKAQPR